MDVSLSVYEFLSVILSISGRPYVYEVSFSFMIGDNCMWVSLIVAER